jgi:hypothetical protein
MLEAIRTFFGRVRGQHREKETVVVEGQLWRCTLCGKVFLTTQEGDIHGSKCVPLETIYRRGDTTQG